MSPKTADPRTAQLEEVPSEPTGFGSSSPASQRWAYGNSTSSTSRASTTLGGRADQGLRKLSVPDDGVDL